MTDRQRDRKRERDSHTKRVRQDSWTTDSTMPIGLLLWLISVKIAKYLLCCTHTLTHRYIILCMCVDARIGSPNNCSQMTRHGQRLYSSLLWLKECARCIHKAFHHWRGLSSSIFPLFPMPSWPRWHTGRGGQLAQLYTVLYCTLHANLKQGSVLIKCHTHPHTQQVTMS